MAGQQILMHQHQGGRFMHAPAMEGMGLVEDRAEVNPSPAQTADQHTGATAVHAQHHQAARV
jgi:hypothetical protein